jgi:hypothetical protein
MDDLKACPFCGKQPEVTAHFKNKTEHRLVHRCTVVGPIVIDWSSKDYLTEKWNTRV